LCRIRVIAAVHFDGADSSVGHAFFASPRAESCSGKALDLLGILRDAVEGRKGRSVASLLRRRWTAVSCIKFLPGQSQDSDARNSSRDGLQIGLLRTGRDRLGGGDFVWSDAGLLLRQGRQAVAGWNGAAWNSGAGARIAGFPVTGVVDDCQPTALRPAWNCGWRPGGAGTAIITGRFATSSSLAGRRLEGGRRAG